MDVFGRAMQARRFLCDAAVAAGYELGVFRGLGEGATIEELAEKLGVATRRLHALLDVLVAIGACGRDGERFVIASVPERPQVANEGWGQMAEVIRSDRPLAIEPGGEARLHTHLASSGADAAAELVGWLGETSLLDLGSGAGAYSKAFLSTHERASATLVDRAEILTLAREWLGPLGDRARFVEGDAASVLDGQGYGAALLANVLHLHDEAMCAALVASAARAVAPGGAVVIKDLRVDDDRRGPLEGLLFALNMALYTEGGSVYPTAQLRTWMAGAGLVEITEHRLVASPDAVVLIGRRAVASREREIAAELDAALARTARDAWESLDKRPGAVQPVLAFPAALRSFLARAVAHDREGAETLIRHYTDAMPRMRIAQLAGRDEPGATLFHTPLDWSRLPRLTAAIERLHALADLGEPFFAPTLAALYERTHYGGFMPLLYGFPADLAYMHASGRAQGLDTLGTIDRYLTAPIVHELCHFARDRPAIEPPHLDECIAGWLGVYVHPELAYPTEHDDALYAAPWLSQVGQALARAFGITNLVRAHAGDHSALPSTFLSAAARLGWDDWCARRTVHFLSDTFAPSPWVALAFAAATGHPLDGTLASLARIPLTSFTLPDDPAFDRAIVEDGLRAMCLSTSQVESSFRTRAQLPDEAITIDPLACAIIGSARYWLPPAIATRLGVPYTLRLHTLSAIPDAAQAICNATPATTPAFTLRHGDDANARARRKGGTDER